MIFGFKEIDEVVHLEGVGDVTVKSSNRARRLSIVLKPFEGIKLTVPRGVPEKEALKFLQDRYDWIERNAKKIRAIEEKQTLFSEDTHFRTRSRELLIRRSDSEKITSRITKKNITISVPEAFDIQEAFVQDKIRAVIHKALRKEAKDHLPQRTEELAALHDFSIKEVVVRNNKTRWGSCTADNRIFLNLHLMRLPDCLIDYVILHELSHTLVKNHSRKFWNLLDEVCPGAKHLDKDLSRYSTYLY